ncbi:MAG TPA: PAS domain-containing protein [Candidatus Limnocylindrales bacterium]|nr:PAS domain-containing protein [Candidatus Limnocylindrales bacterium]
MEQAAAIVGAAVILQIAGALLAYTLGRLLRSPILEWVVPLLLLGISAAGAFRLREVTAAGATPATVADQLSLWLSALTTIGLATANAWLRRRRPSLLDPRRSQEQEHAARLSLFLNEFPAHIWTTDRSLRIDTVAGRGIESLELTAEGLLGRSVEEVFTSVGVVPEYMTAPRRALAGETVPFLTPVRGNMLEGAVAPLHDGDGNIIGTIGISLNVSERERASEQARSEEEILHEILDHTPSIVFLKDREGRFLWVNRRWEELSRRPRTEVVGANDYDFFPPEAATGFRRTDAKVWATGQAETFVEPLVGKRRSRTMLCSKFLLRRSDGTPYALCGIANDITERARMEEELKRREALLVEAQALASLASWELDFRSGEHFASEHIYTMLGIDARENTISTFDDFLAHVIEEDRATLMEAVHRAFVQNEPTVAEFRVRQGDGQIRWLRAQGRMDRDEDGVPVRFYGFTQDIDEERRAEEEIRRLTSQLEHGVRERTLQLEGAVQELSSFSYAVSHDLRQPLRSIAGFLALMEEEAGDSLGSVAHYLERARTATRRMDNIIGDLLALARVTHAPLRRDRLDLTELAREISIELSRSEPNRDVQWELSDGLSASADPGLARLVLQNLMSNAFKFTRKTPRPVIEVGSREIDGQTVLYVRDNGVGFDMARAKRLFEPFQRLHDAAEFEGSGIGLATVARIVRHHGGWIRAESRPQHGATFLFTLPAAVETEEEAA